MLEDKPVYIDCKYYSDATLAKFSIQDEYTDDKGKLTAQYLMEKATNTWHEIQTTTNTIPKLIYLNLTSWHEAPAEYYDELFNPVDNFTDAHIILIRACLLKGANGEYHPAFKQFLTELRNFS